MLLLPEEYVLLSILKSLYGLFLEGACGPVIGPQCILRRPPGWQLEKAQADIYRADRANHPA